MKNISKLILIALLFSTQFLNASDYEKMLKEVLSAKPHSSKKYTADGLTFQKDAGVFELSKGEFHLYNKVNGKYCFAEFVGEGEFSFMPPIKVEQEQMKREFGEAFFNMKFDQMFIIFSDGFENYLAENTKPNNRLKLASSVKDRVMKLIVNYKKTHLGITGLNKALLEKNAKPLFYAYMKNDEQEFVWGFDEYDLEECALYKIVPSQYPMIYNDQLSPVTQFHKEADYFIPRQDRESEDKDEIKVNQYTITANIPKGLYFTCSTEMEITAQTEGEQWISFGLNGDLEIKSITSDGKDIQYYKPEESHNVWVKLNEPMKKGEDFKIKMDYEGDIIKRQGDWFIIKGNSAFYPKYGFYKRSLFDLEFTTYHTYRFTSSGELLSEERKGDFKTTKWSVKEPGIHVAFNLGVFSEREIKKVEGKHPDMLVHYVNSELVDNVVLDLKQSYEFYSKIFGPISTNKFYGTEIPSPHGQAFPNFLHLSYLAFQSASMMAETYSNYTRPDFFFVETLIGHEMAHQWWLNVKTYRDPWMSEGFAEYSSLLYYQLSLGNNENFFKNLAKKKRNLIRASKRDKPKGPAGPVGLGTRLGRDYSLVVYERGAWTLHMLRNMLLDLNKMDDKPFFDLMGGFFKKFQGKSISTEDFKEYAEEFLNADMGWFFDQWIYGYKIPKYTFGWKATDATDKKGNKYKKILCRVRTENVDEDFQMSIPITVVYSDGVRNSIRAMVRGSFLEFPINLPEVPEEIIFNDFESVLCEQEYDDYEDIEKPKE